MEKIILRHVQTSQTLSEQQPRGAQNGEMGKEKAQPSVQDGWETINWEAAWPWWVLSWTEATNMPLRQRGPTAPRVRTSITRDVMPPLCPAAAEITSGVQGPVLAPSYSQTWMYFSKSSKGSQDDEGFYHLISMLCASLDHCGWEIKSPK